MRRYPSLSIEAIANDQGFNEAERQRHVETMRLAGFLACAGPDELAKIQDPFPFPECQAHRRQSFFSKGCLIATLARR
jgi:hypothetical protein